MSRRVGIEIEMVGLGRRQIAEVVANVLGGDMEEFDPDDPEEYKLKISVAGGPCWTVMDDDSLDAPASARGELVTPPLLESELPLLAEIVDVLRAAGATVNASCGLHVHVGIEGCGVEHLNRLVVLVERWEPAILDQILPSRRQFAAPLDPSFLAEFHVRPPMTHDGFWALWYGDANWRSRRDRYDPIRYRGLNLHSFRRLRTVEFRYFNGSIESSEVLGHVKSCLRLVEEAGFPAPEDKHEDSDDR